MIVPLSIFRRVVLLGSFLVFAGTFVLFGATIYVIRGFEGNAELPADCVLVFGAAIRRGGEAGPGIERRVQTAVRLYHDTQVRTLIMSGGKGTGQQVSEAEVMRNVAVREGVVASDIRTEESATSTIENLTFSQPMMKDCTSVIGVSDRYHLSRIRYIASRLKLQNFSTHPSDWNASRAFEIRSTIRESLGLIYTILTLSVPKPL